MEGIINFAREYEKRRRRKLLPPSPPAVFHCWTCKRTTRYYLVDGSQTCALCQWPIVRLADSLPMPCLSGAKNPQAPLWLPVAERSGDREIVAWLCWEILLECKLFYCPTHYPTPTQQGPCAADLHAVFGAERAQDQALIGDALQALIDKQWAVRFGRGVAGDSFRYYARLLVCCREGGERGGRVVSAGEVVPAVLRDIAQRTSEKVP